MMDDAIDILALLEEEDAREAAMKALARRYGGPSALELVRETEQYLLGCALPEERRPCMVDALYFAAEAHAYQRRAGGQPFICHPAGVMRILVEDLDADVATAQSGLLHDVVEDTGTPLSRVEKRFGAEVAYIVDGVTDVPLRRYDFARRMRQSHKKMLAHAQHDPRVIKVKLADRLHNLRSCSDLDGLRRDRLGCETLEFHLPLCRDAGYAIADELQELAQRAAYDDGSRRRRR